MAIQRAELSVKINQTGRTPPGQLHCSIATCFDPKDSSPQSRPYSRIGSWQVLIPQERE